MARIEWVKHRLDNWARYKSRESSGGLGFSSQSSFLRDPSSSSGYREAIIPIDDCEASVTNDAVESLKPSRSHLYETLHAIYLRDTGIVGAAREFGRGESTIKAQLCEADKALAAWFVERQARKEKSFTP